MVKKRVLDSLKSTDSPTRVWKSRFAAARMAYEDGKFKDCERLLHSLLRQADGLPERDFAVSAIEIALGALYLAMDRQEEARKRLDASISKLSGAADPSTRELYAVALRFRAEISVDTGDLATAERELRESVSVLEELGVDVAVQLSCSLTDLGGLYVLQGQLKEAENLLMSAMHILENAVGHEDPEFARAAMLYSVSTVYDKSEALDTVEDGICRLQYHLGQNNPNLTRAMRRLIKVRVERGEQDQLALAAEKIAGLGKVLQGKK